MKLVNKTRIPDDTHIAEMNEVCYVMGWPRFTGTLFVKYRDGKVNQWRGTYYWGAVGGYIKLRYTRILFYLNYERKGIRVKCWGRKKCRMTGRNTAVEAD